MRLIRLDIEYDGTNYCGWQIQSHRVTRSEGHKRTIQETIERALRRILQERVRVIGSGRTDAGVHAFCQTAHFKTNSAIPVEGLQKALNALLPQDIAVLTAKEEKSSFHSRFGAVSKVYRYTILNRSCRSALLAKRAYFCPWQLDIALMKSEAEALLGRHDFSSFRASGSANKDAVRTIRRVAVAQKGRLLHIDIEADGFLYNMVRIIVGTLIDIGRGKLPAGSMKRILKARDRKKAGFTAPPEGLYLVKVKYQISN